VNFVPQARFPKWLGKIDIIATFLENAENRGVHKNPENSGFRIFIICRENAENLELLTTDLL
jgi:hypothetical protein